MTLFWMATAVLILLTVLFLALPMLARQHSHDAAQRDELNKAFYQDRLAELEAEDRAGLVGDQQELIVDLKQSLLDDVSLSVPSSEAEAMQKRRLGWVLLPSILFVIGVSYGLYFTFGGSQQVAHWQQVQNSLPELSTKLMTPNVALSDDELNDLLLALRSHLHDTTNDVAGWQLLGRMGMATQRVEDAIGAMQQAYRLAPDDSNVTLGYAQALMLSPEAFERNQARSLLEDLYQEKVDDLRVFSLLALEAYERQAYDSALDYWSQALARLSPDDERYTMFKQSIAAVKKQLGQTANPAQSVSVTVSLAPTVPTHKNAVLIVSLHSMDGTPMPIAAARFPAADFPRTVVLDDGDSLVQDRPLSNVKQVMVRVRLDVDGNVATQAGDWHGTETPVKLGSAVNIEINQPY